MKNESKRLLSRICNEYKERRLMQQLHRCFGIDFEQPFTLERWEGQLTENTFRKKYKGVETAFLLIGEKGPQWNNFHVTAVDNCVFNPRKEPMVRGCYEAFFTKGDFDEARKAVGKVTVTDGWGNKSTYECWVMVPTGFAPPTPDHVLCEKADRLIKGRLKRIRKYRTCIYQSGRFAYANDIAIDECRVPSSFQVTVAPDKSGYLPRTDEFRSRADAIIREKRKNDANAMDWSASVYAAEISVAELKRKISERLEDFDTDVASGYPDWWKRYCEFRDLVGKLYDAAEKLGGIKRAIEAKSLVSVDKTISVFESIRNIVNECLSEQKEEDAVKV